MIAKLVAAAVRAPLMAAVLALALLGIGLRSYLQLDIEAYPNPVAPMIEIIVSSAVRVQPSSPPSICRWR